MQALRHLRCAKIGSSATDGFDATLLACDAPVGHDSEGHDGPEGVNISGIEFGYNFDTIVNTQDNATRGNPAQGTLGQFIFSAKALTSAISQVGQPANQETSIFMISDGNPIRVCAPGSPTSFRARLPSST